MNAATIVIVLVLALLVGLAISYTTILKVMRIRRTPTTWISALPPEGQVEVAGKAGEKTILSPINNTPCAAYKVEIAELKKSNKGSRWETVRKLLSEEPFELNDDTGTVQVYPAGADFIVSRNSESDELDSNQVAAIESLGVKTTGFFGGEKHMKITEYVIRPQQEIYVLGRVQQTDGKKSIASAGEASLVISDQGERSALRTLYWRIAKYVLISLAVGIILIIIVYSNGK